MTSSSGASDNWEQAALEEVREALVSVADFIAPNSSIEDVRLEGEKPDTKLVVDMTVWGTPSRREWLLWDDTFMGAPGQRTEPYGVASLVSVWVEEEARAPYKQ